MRTSTLPTSLTRSAHHRPFHAELTRPPGRQASRLGKGRRILPPDRAVSGSISAGTSTWSRTSATLRARPPATRPTPPARASARSSAISRESRYRRRDRDRRLQGGLLQRLLGTLAERAAKFLTSPHADSVAAAGTLGPCPRPRRPRTTSSHAPQGAARLPGARRLRLRLPSFHPGIMPGRYDLRKTAGAGMHDKYLGDSFDIVKRFWREQLACVAPLYAIPGSCRTHSGIGSLTLTTIPVLNLQTPA